MQVATGFAGLYSLVRAQVAADLSGQYSQLQVSVQVATTGLAG